MTIPAEPNPEQTGNGQGHKKSNRSDLALIAVLTSIPAAVLFVICLWKWTLSLDAEGWTVVFSALLFASTTAQAIYAKWQRDIMQKGMSATQKAADAAKDNAEAAQATLKAMQTQQRAWLAFVDATFRPTHSSEPITTKLQVVNTGQTPAFIERRLAKMFMLPIETEFLQDEIDEVVEAVFNPQGDVEIVMPPHTEGYEFTNPHPDISRKDFDPNKTMPKTAFLVGAICYRDVFKMRRISVCCYRWGYSGFVGHHRHNYMT
jgi:hypothetical protein